MAGKICRHSVIAADGCRFLYQKHMLATAFSFLKPPPDLKRPEIPFRRLLVLAVWGWLLFAGLPFPGNAQVPAQIHFQGRIQVGGTDFSGTGQFKFALVSADGATTHWSNDGSSTAGAAPASAVSLPVAKGVYSLLLGDPALPNMTRLPADAFAHADVRLRVWFDDGVSGFQQLAPDQRIASVAYAQQAQVAATVAAGSITTDRLEPALQTTVGKVDQLYSAYAWNLRTNPPPQTHVGTMTITPSAEGNVRGIKVIKMPESQHTIVDSADSYTVSNKDTVSQLVVQRPLTPNPTWREWVAYCQQTAAVKVGPQQVGSGNEITTAQYDKIFREVVFQFTGSSSVTIRLQAAFPVGYRVELGSDGLYYETLTLQPKTYSVE